VKKCCADEIQELLGSYIPMLKLGYAIQFGYKVSQITVEHALRRGGRTWYPGFTIFVDGKPASNVSDRGAMKYILLGHTWEQTGGQNLGEYARPGI